MSKANIGQLQLLYKWKQSIGVRTCIDTQYQIWVVCVLHTIALHYQAVTSVLPAGRIDQCTTVGYYPSSAAGTHRLIERTASTVRKPASYCSSYRYYFKLKPAFTAGCTDCSRHPILCTRKWWIRLWHTHAITTGAVSTDFQFILL